MIRCVICQKAIPVGEDLYTNAWEKSRKRYPCCSQACCDSFDPDQHWLPVVKPEQADREEEVRLLDVTQRRLKDGDSPTVVIREMLLAGVATRALRKVLNEAQASSESNHRVARQLGVGGVIMGVLTGQWSFFKSTDKRRPRTLEAALSDLDRWDSHFSDPSGRPTS